MSLPKLKYLIPALTNRRNWITLLRFPSVYTNPIASLKRYVMKNGKYPTTWSVKTKHGIRNFHLGNYFDFDTLNAVFCRNDYPAISDIKTIVDLGANIGIASSYFLDNSPKATVYAFEPNPRNFNNLEKNLQDWMDNVFLHEAAVAEYKGEATFYLEHSGRSGSLIAKHKESINVEVLEINEVLNDIITKNGFIDLLKIDIEGYEEQVLMAIRPEILSKIMVVYAEYRGAFRLEGFDKRQIGNVTVFSRN